jgi:hypothetical protein
MNRFFLKIPLDHHSLYSEKTQDFVYIFLCKDVVKFSLKIFVLLSTDGPDLCIHI